MRTKIPIIDEGFLSNLLDSVASWLYRKTDQAMGCIVWHDIARSLRNIVLHLHRLDYPDRSYALFADHDETMDHITSIRKYADQLGPQYRLRFEQALVYLATWNGAPGNHRTILFRDFAPYSLGFVCETCRDGESTVDIRGGLIYSGPDQPLDGSAPAYTVSLTPTIDHTWTVHT